MLRIERKEDCTGCYGCSQICPKQCIEMRCDKEGFWYPKIDEEMCIQCNLCEKVCPVNAMNCEKKKIRKDPRAYAAYSKDEISRRESSSGGIFPILAKMVLAKKGAVFGAAFDENNMVYHKKIKNYSEIGQLQGAKYVQSRIGNTYFETKKVLEENKMVLFSGTPCQIAGLKQYLGKQYENLICVDLICHGVPSPTLWKKYLEWIRQDKKIRKINFREKSKGWLKYSLNIQYEKEEKDYCKSLKKDLYLQNFIQNTCLRPSCYDCRFKGIQRESDITLADYWGIQNQYRKMFDNKGTSLVWIHTEKAREIWDGLRLDLVFQEVDIEKSIIENPCAVKSVNKNEKRENFYSQLDNIQETMEAAIFTPRYIRIKNEMIDTARVIKKQLVVRINEIRRNNG